MNIAVLDDYLHCARELADWQRGRTGIPIVAK